MNSGRLVLCVHDTPGEPEPRSYHAFFKADWFPGLSTADLIELSRAGCEMPINAADAFYTRALAGPHQWPAGNRWSPTTLRLRNNRPASQPSRGSDCRECVCKSCGDCRP